MQLRHTPVALLLVAACTPAPKDAAPAAPQEVVFTATDYAFSGPDTIAPGVTSVRMVNHGATFHHMILGRFDEGKTVQDLQAFVQANPTGEPPFMTWRGAAGVVMPGDSAGETIDLPAGRYVVMCFVNTPGDSVPHMVKGMMKEFVAAGEPHQAPMPAAEGEIHLSDFTFAIPAMTAGTHTFHLINDGPQTHEAQLVRLNDGATVDAFMAALAPGSTTLPPGVFVGGSGALSSGLDNYWTVTLAPGTYVFVCFVPDRTDGMPHVMKGMMKEFTVSAS